MATSGKHYRVHLDHQAPVIEGTHDEKTVNVVERMSKNLKINILSLTHDEIDFDLVGVDASIANALRRILLSEVT